MNFDFKVTTWERISVDEEHEQEVLQLIKEGTIVDVQGIYNLMEEKGNANLDSEVLVEFTEQMSLTANGGANTIEVYGDNGELEFENGMR